MYLRDVAKAFGKSRGRGQGELNVEESQLFQVARRLGFRPPRNRPAGFHRRGVPAQVPLETHPITGSHGWMKTRPKTPAYSHGNELRSRPTQPQAKTHLSIREEIRQELKRKGATHQNRTSNIVIIR
ncbi:hypothetical protein OE88DRAFT_1644112 [Heliocybe sulcata]|uniref:Uncharacterized protein n=1 Tax=Heliocybe sulcata TaxID=5364 RepID=A0A5C3N6I3_9AGAM|nr:hypothetical protein OE88DRAFT_1644112 [Heliocybe sulcata]